MAPSIEDKIREITRKEDEKYLLSHFKLIASRNDINFALSENEELRDKHDGMSYSDFKKEVLHTFYSSFFSKQLFYDLSQNDKGFHEWYFLVYKKVTQQMQLESGKTKTIDSELKGKDCKIAFCASLLIFIELSGKVKNADALPPAIRRIIYNECCKVYPVELDRLINHLHREDKDFWDQIYILIYEICMNRVDYDKRTPSKKKEDVKSDLLPSSRNKVYSIITSKKHPNFEDGNHFRNYLKKMIYFEFLNVFDKHCGHKKRISYKEEYIEDFEDRISNMESGENSRINIYDIDRNNEYELQHGLVNVLRDEGGEIYKSLVEGIEQSVEAFMLSYVDEKSSKEIAQKLFGDKMEGNELETKAATLRKQVSRVKDQLPKRFYNLLGKIHR